MHEIIKKGDHYIVVAESFYPDYKYANYSPWGGAGALLGGGLLSPWNMLKKCDWQKNEGEIDGE